ncbi:hypothetical protein [Edaphobacter aggregans]|uniref:hypothetical protein n=1 Tax=Edaphobacter aggregans TaxID=570835 RepID=UPI0012F79561|nr:hypothetical protein [Edaphobacter aggregans]
MLRMFASTLRSSSKSALALAFLFSSILDGGARTLYVISGTPTNYSPEGVAVQLFTLTEGKPHLEDTLVSARDGLYSIQSDLSGSYAIFSPHGVPSRVRILRTGPSLSSADYSIDGGIAQGIDSKLLMIGDKFNTSLIVPVHRTGAGGPPSVMVIPLNKSGEPQKIPLSSVTLEQLTFTGVPGGPEGAYSPIGRIANGHVVFSIEGFSERLSDLPTRLQSGHEGEQIGVVAASQNFVVLSLPSRRSDLESQHGETFRTLFVKDRRLNQWREVRLKGNVSRSRLFGDWLASIEESWQSDNVSNPGREESESADVARLFKYGEGAFANIPGVLLLDNLETKTHVEIKTGEEDSEVLDVTDNHICYRVNDSIFEGEINGEGIGKIVEIGHGPELRSVHWAFWK